RTGSGRPALLLRGAAVPHPVRGGRSHRAHPGNGPTSPLTLAGLGYVRQDGPAFSLTPQVLSLGYAYLSSLGIGDLAQGPMQALVDQVQESSSVTVLDGDDIVYVARVPTSRLMTMSAGLGTRLPAYPTSLGRVLLAGLDADRLDEYLRRVRLVALTPHTI